MVNKVLNYSIICILGLTSIMAYSQDLPDHAEKIITGLDNLQKVKQLGARCWKLREQHSDSALIYGNYAIKLADSLGFYNQKAQISNYVGVVYMHYLKDTKTAIPYYHDALEAATRVNDTIQIAYAYNNLGDAFYLIGNVPLAIQYGENSLFYFEKISNERGLAYSYINLGYAYRADKKFDLALQYFFKAINIRNKNEDKVGIASATYEVALTYFNKQEFDLALKYFNQSLKLNKAIDNKMYMAMSLNGIGDVLFKGGKYKKALEMYKKSLTYNETGGHLAGLVYNKLGIALVYSKTGNEKAGEEVLQEALDISNQLGFSSNILETYRAYAEFYKNLGKYKLSIESYNKYLDIYDSLYSVQQFEALSEMQNRFQVSLNLNKLNQDLESKKRESFYLIVILFLVLLLVAILFWRYIVINRLSSKLKLINDSKDKLFSIISHDLKAPFSSLLGFSELLINEAKKTDNERIKKYSDYINQMSKQSVNLITNLTNWSRSQRGVIKITKTKINLSVLIDSILKMHSTLARQKDIKLVISASPDFNIYADEDVLRTIITNLVSNAIKFTPEKGEISVSAIDKKNSFQVIVKDSGIGISEGNIDKLFKVKENFTTPGTNDEKGTGLGLIICKDLVALHGGSMNVDSEPGKGTTFCVTIPQ